MTTITHNIDDVRAEIMRLENAETFVQADWDRVQKTLIEQDRPAALADAQRRMATARDNAPYFVGLDLDREGEMERLRVCADAAYSHGDYDLSKWYAERLGEWSVSAETMEPAHASQ